jgi:N-methylhydantoinase B
MLPTIGMSPIRHGDVLRHRMAGGGGWGDPLDRDPKLVLADVVDEKLSVAYVRAVYGVVVDPETLTLDAEATRQLRRALRAARPPRDDRADRPTPTVSTPRSAAAHPGED